MVVVLIAGGAPQRRWCVCTKETKTWSSAHFTFWGRFCCGNHPQNKTLLTCHVGKCAAETSSPWDFWCPTLHIPYLLLIPTYTPCTLLLPSWEGDPMSSITKTGEHWVMVPMPTQGAMLSPLLSLVLPECWTFAPWCWFGLSPTVVSFSMSLHKISVNMAELTWSWKETCFSDASCLYYRFWCLMKEIKEILYSIIQWYLKSHGSQGKSPVTGKRETLCPFSKRVERKTLGTTDLSASPLCLGRSWNRSS